ncbi:MAG: pirin family protein [Bacteroidota bacterium]
MKRKEFIRKSLAGSIGLGIGVKTLAETSNSEAVNLDPKVQVGFNHIKTMETKTSTTVLHKADSRGDANHGWLHSRHSFSFANYYNPERMNFGVLRVLNDDIVAPGMGFGTHPHSNMEIISIPLAGDLEHKDSMGTTSVIKQGDIQVMSAGTGIYHSEYNANKDKEVKFLQIWVIPNEENVSPRYDQISIKELATPNQFNQVLSPNDDDDGVWIHQDAWFHIGQFDQSTEQAYQIHREGNGVYAFMLDGEAEIAGQALESRDGFGIWDVDNFNIKAKAGARILLMEVPMN